MKTLRLINTIPSGYSRVDLVADTYQTNSIKSQERLHRGESSKVIIQSVKPRVPRNFSVYMKNGENKERLLEIILQVISENRLKFCKS